MNPDYKDSNEQALPAHLRDIEYVTIRRRRMTKTTAERLARAARKMVKDFRKFIKRKEQRGELCHPKKY